MNNSEQPDTAVTVSCEECLKEVPSSEAKIEEASDYVRHFCGLECYRLWREKTDKESG